MVIATINRALSYERFHSYRVGGSQKKGGLNAMIKSIFIRAIIATLAAVSPVTTTAYISTGTYYADTQSVVDSEGEEWGYDSELPDRTPVIIIFDSLETNSRYDDIVTGLVVINQERK